MDAAAVRLEVLACVYHPQYSGAARHLHTWAAAVRVFIKLILVVAS